MSVSRAVMSRAGVIDGQWLTYCETFEQLAQRPETMAETWLA